MGLFFFSAFFFIYFFRFGVVMGGLSCDTSVYI